MIGSYAVGMTMSTERMPGPGETILGKDFRQLHGGKGSNQAIGVARLGGTSCYGGCVGTDMFGDNALSKLREEGVNTDCVKRSSEASTGVGFVMVEESGDNRIIIDFGANNHLYPEDIRKMEGIIDGSSYLLLQLEINMTAVEEAVRIAVDKGVPVILNPAPFQRISDEVLGMVTFLTPNESEAALLLGENEADLSSEEMCGELFARYKTSVILTVGAEGAVYRTPNGAGRAPCRSVKACDTTGAGDTFNAALAVALTEGKSLENALAFANVAASISVTRHGVVPSIPFRDEVDRILEG